MAPHPRGGGQVGVDVLAPASKHGEVEAQGIPGLKLRDATDADLEHLKGLTGLQYLSLGGTQVTDGGLEHLSGLTALRWLELSDAQVTDAGR